MNRVGVKQGWLLPPMAIYLPRDDEDTWIKLIKLHHVFLHDLWKMSDLYPIWLGSLYESCLPWVCWLLQSTLLVHYDVIYWTLVSQIFIDIHCTQHQHICCGHLECGHRLVPAIDNTMAEGLTSIVTCRYCPNLMCVLQIWCSRQSCALPARTEPHHQHPHWLSTFTLWLSS